MSAEVSQSRMTIQILSLLFIVIELNNLMSHVQADICQSNITPQYEFYPNITSESAFVQCQNSSGKYISVHYVCPDGLTFTPRKSSNDLSPLCGTSQNTFDCSRQKNGNGSYSGDKSLYASCSNGQPQDLHQCPLGQYLDGGKLTCEYSCLVNRRIGSFPTADGGYYICTYDYRSAMWSLTIHSCPSGTTYNEILQFCLTLTPSEDDTSTANPDTTTETTTANPGPQTANTLFSSSSTESSSIPWS